MPDKPASEIRIDGQLVRHLVLSQVEPVCPGVATSRLIKAAEGWDSEVWRLGDELAMRLPRRAAAAPLVLNEQRTLPLLAPALEARGVRVPLPLVCGAPDARYPWPWSLVPWIEGDRGIDVPRPARAGWAPPLADALVAMHAVAPSAHPVNPFRGRPLVTRAAAFAERMTSLRAHGTIDEALAAALNDAWDAGLRAAEWRGEPVWIHGDLHPGNLVARGSSIRGIIDFGDVTAGDPAYDLAVAWLAFDARGRRRFVAATRTRYDEATWVRARAWAASIAVMLMTHSDDEPDYAALGRESAVEVADGS